MMQSLHAHSDALALVALGLLVASESLPFVQKWEGNGLVHAAMLKIKKMLAGQAKEEIAKIESEQ